MLTHLNSVSCSDIDVKYIPWNIIRRVS